MRRPAGGSCRGGRIEKERARRSRRRRRRGPGRSGHDESVRRRRMGLMIFRPGGLRCRETATLRPVSQPVGRAPATAGIATSVTSPRPRKRQMAYQPTSSGTRRGRKRAAPGEAWWFLCQFSRPRGRAEAGPATRCSGWSRIPRGASSGKVEKAVHEALHVKRSRPGGWARSEEPLPAHHPSPRRLSRMTGTCR